MARAEPDFVSDAQADRRADEVLFIGVADDRLHLERLRIDPRDVGRRVGAELLQAGPDALRRRGTLPRRVERPVGLPADVVRIEVEIDEVLLHRRLPTRHPHHLGGSPQVHVVPLAVFGHLDAVRQHRFAVRHHLPAVGWMPFPELAGVAARLRRRWGVPGGLRRAMLVTTTPPSGTGLTEFMLTVGGGTAQPIQVSDGGVALASISNTSTDSRNPW